MHHGVAAGREAEFLLQRRNVAKQQLAHAVEELAAVIPVQRFIKGKRGMVFFAAAEEFVEGGIGELNLARGGNQRHAVRCRHECGTEPLVAAG